MDKSKSKWVGLVQQLKKIEVIVYADDFRLRSPKDKARLHGKWLHLREQMIEHKKIKACSEKSPKVGVGDE